MTEYGLQATTVEGHDMVGRSRRAVPALFSRPYAGRMRLNGHDMGKASSHLTLCPQTILWRGGLEWGCRHERTAALRREG
jgi:hypothetical protein